MWPVRTTHAMQDTLKGVTMTLTKGSQDRIIPNRIIVLKVGLSIR